MKRVFVALMLAVAVAVGSVVVTSAPNVYAEGDAGNRRQKPLPVGA